MINYGLPRRYAPRNDVIASEEPRFVPQGENEAPQNMVLHVSIFLNMFDYCISCVKASFSLRTEESFGLIATTCFR